MTCRTGVSAVLMTLLLSACARSLPTGPYVPDGTEELSWEDLLASDSSYPSNVYLTRFVEWVPGTVGAARRGTEYTDAAGIPLLALTKDALGPPEGGGSLTGGEGLTCPVGINGWAVWEFDPDFVIIDGTGNDFITFTKTWAWGGQVDGLCSELAHVRVSANGSTWYQHGGENFDINPDPSISNSGYSYGNVSNLHGNVPTWANFRKDMVAEEIVDPGTGIEEWTELSGVTVSRYFESTDLYLGGVSFDLSDFHLVGDDSTPWPVDGEMKYLMIIDDDTILDGQDYVKDWSLGANLMAAMGINVLPAP